MKPITREWVNKAEGDILTAQRELYAEESPNYDACCFHAQQCAEKYLKACLQEADIPFGKTHNLSAILNLILPLTPSWEELRPQLNLLSGFAVEFRYPGESADKELAEEAVSLAKHIRKEVRIFLKIEQSS